MYFNYKPGYVEVITGCMFAGKTEELIRRLNVLSYSDANILVFKPSIDVRYDKDDIVSHIGRRIPSRSVNGSEGILPYIHLWDKQIDVVAIDEVQFFDEGIVDVIDVLAGSGVRVIVAGLDLDFRGEPFGPISKIMAKAEFITKLPAVCMKCGAPATRSQRLVDGKPASEKEDTVVVGADESYEARCRHCHIVDKED